MKTLLLLFAYLFISPVFSPAQEIGDLDGQWIVTEESLVIIDRTYLVDSLGNQTDKIAAIDTVFLESEKYINSVWEIQNSIITIRRSNSPSESYIIRFLESGLELTSKNSTQKYWVEQPEKNKIILRKTEDEHAILTLRLSKK